jgi:DeoR/GlpR family transcriptional regulator of sugar metabolism
MNEIAAFERRNRILDRLRGAARVSTRELSDLFGVSEVTIRQDLRVLEEDRWLSRIHGGAQAGPRLQQELPMVVREHQNIDVKRNIARRAAEWVAEGDRIALDGSTTAFQLTHFLKERKDLTVVTNNFHVAHAFASSKGVETIVLGGTLRSDTWSIVGSIAEEMISLLRVDKGFFGAAGVSVERGLTDADLREAQIKRTMAESSLQVIAMVDSSKFGKESFATSVPWELIQVMISDTLPSAFAEQLGQSGIQYVKSF